MIRLLLVETTPFYGRGPAPYSTESPDIEIVLVARGASNKDIAAHLGIGTRTVETHVSNAGVHSRTEAINVALQRGLIAQE